MGNKLQRNIQNTKKHLSTTQGGDGVNSNLISGDLKNKAIKDGGSTAGLPPNNKQKDHQ